MSDEERKRNEVMVRVKKGDLGLRNAAEILGISYRQVKGLRKRYRKQGAKGLVHGNVGRRSNRAKPKKFRERVLRLVRQKYSGEAGVRFGPDAGSRTPGQRRRLRGRPGNAAAMDAGGRSVEPRAEGPGTSETTGAQGAFWRTGAVGR